MKRRPKRHPHSYETKRYLSQRVRLFWTADERAKASERTLARLASGNVRQQVEARDGP
jgi:hypothetical protein